MRLSTSSIWHMVFREICASIASNLIASAWYLISNNYNSIDTGTWTGTICIRAATRAHISRNTMCHMLDVDKSIELHKLDSILGPWGYEPNSLTTAPIGRARAEMRLSATFDRHTYFDHIITIYNKQDVGYIIFQNFENDVPHQVVGYIIFQNVEKWCTPPFGGVHHFSKLWKLVYPTISWVHRSTKMWSPSQYQCLVR